MTRPILVSACLLGINTRYDGLVKNDPAVRDFFACQDALPIPVCPEQLAGLPTPRPKSCFARGSGDDVLDGQGRIVSEDGHSLDDIFIRGAAEALKICRLAGCQEAILKERSPSCGVHWIYRGQTRTPGQGVTSALLKRNAVRIMSEEDLYPTSGTPDSGSD